MRLSRSDFERLVFEAYRQHGWPMDPSQFAERLLASFGVEVDQEDPDA